MGPLDDIGPYSETMITTRKTDVEEETDNKPGFIHIVIGVLLIGPTCMVLIFMGLFFFKNIGLIVACVILGLCILACGYYGTNKSMFDRYRYRTTKAQREKIERRLSDIKNI
jgi:hypothetical protein